MKHKYTKKDIHKKLIKNPTIRRAKNPLRCEKESALEDTNSYLLHRIKLTWLLEYEAPG